MLERITAERTKMGDDGKIKIVIIDSRDFMRGGYKLLIEKHNDFEVVGDTGSSTSGIKLVRQLKPDVIVINNNKYGIGGIETSQLVIDEHPEARVLPISDAYRKELICRATKAGVSGFLLEECIFDEQLSRGIRTVFKGEKYLCPKLMTIVANSWANQASAWAPTEFHGFLKHGVVLKDTLPS
jgi:DNA-binding NarL/FixJ family response regulator